MKKKFISIMTVFAMIFTLLPTTAYATDDDLTQSPQIINQTHEDYITSSIGDELPYETNIVELDVSGGNIENENYKIEDECIWLKRFDVTYVLCGSTEKKIHNWGSLPGADNIENSFHIRLNNVTVSGGIIAMDSPFSINLEVLEDTINNFGEINANRITMSGSGTVNANLLTVSQMYSTGMQSSLDITDTTLVVYNRDKSSSTWEGTVNLDGSADVTIIGNDTHPILKVGQDNVQKAKVTLKGNASLKCLQKKREQTYEYIVDGIQFFNSASLSLEEQSYLEAEDKLTSNQYGPGNAINGYDGAYISVKDNSTIKMRSYGAALVAENVDISGGTVETTGGIWGTSGVEISGGTVDIDTEYSNSIYSQSGNIVISGAANIKATGYYGIVGENITIFGNAVVNSTSTNDCGIYSPNTITINGGDVAAIGSYKGILANSSIIIDPQNMAKIKVLTGTDETSAKEIENSPFTTETGITSLLGEHNYFKTQVIYNVIVENDGNGTASANVTSAVEGETVALTATPNSGYEFAYWKVISGDVNINNNEFIMPNQNVTVKAIFEKVEIPVTNIELKKETLSLTVGDNANLTYTITPDTATYKAVIWESSNNQVAQVNESGTIKAVGAGTAIITVKTVDGNFTDICEVTVTKPSSGGGSSSGGSSSGGSSSSGNKTETTTNPDGSTTTTVTKPDGSKTETTKYPDGSQEVIQTDKDGTVTTTTIDTNGNKTEVIENTDGSSVTTVTNKDGSGSKTTVDTNAKVEIEATITEDNTTLPPVDKTSDNTITVNMPDGTSKVEIPVKNADNNTVAVLVKADGTEEIIKTSVTTENGVSVTLNDGDTIKIIDNNKDFIDVSSNFWGANAVDFVTSREIFNGTSENTFSPNTAMTRAMIVTVLARLNGVDTSTGDTWYEVGQKWAMEKGISDGLNMNKSLTREQLATMLYRYCKNPATSGDISDFADSENVSSWATYAMSWAVENGLISGMGDGTLNPQGEATRAQVATILYRFISNYN